MRVDGVNGIKRVELNVQNPQNVKRTGGVQRNEIERVIDELARRSLRERRGALSRLKVFYKALRKSLLDLFG